MTLKVTFVVSFEDEQATVALGTGFVVDKERGLILTNRHITGVGPVCALAIFDRHEELDVEVWSWVVLRKVERKTKWENSRETTSMAIWMCFFCKLRIVANGCFFPETIPSLLQLL